MKASPASLVLLRFIENTTDSIWDNYEEELLWNINNPIEFAQTFSNLSKIHSDSVITIGRLLYLLSLRHKNIQYWCSMLICLN